MKGMLNYLFIIILIGFISSCSTKRDKPIQEGNWETIRFDENQVKELPFSSFVDTIELIPLETTEKNLIGEVNRIVFDDNKYYVRSTNSMQNGKLFVFDKDGKFLQQIGRKGGGPDEYIEMDDSLFPIITRMVLQNLFAEKLPVDMRVDFGSSNVLVSQHLLDGAQVCSALQKVCGKGMAESVRTDFLMDTCQFGLLLDDEEYHHAGERSATPV